MADRPSDSPRPGPSGLGSPGSPGPPRGGGDQAYPGQPARSIARPVPRGASTDTPIGQAAPQAGAPLGAGSGGGPLVQALPMLIEFLEHEPAMGLAIVDGQGRAQRANRRFLALTTVASDGPGQKAGQKAGAPGDRRKGVWARMGPEAVRTASTERRVAVLRFIHEGVQVQCDVWPLPAVGGEPLFLVVAVEGRHEPAASHETPEAGGGAAGTVEPGASEGAADRFVTLAPLLAELGALGALTARELEVLALIGEGLATREIAERLGRSPRTIERHCDAIHKKLGTSNRVQMARYAMQAGLTAEAGKLKRV